MTVKGGKKKGQKGGVVQGREEYGDDRRQKRKKGTRNEGINERRKEKRGNKGNKGKHLK